MNPAEKILAQYGQKWFDHVRQIRKLRHPKQLLYNIYRLGPEADQQLV
jgi:hypothetical protein